jgi:hypothetical protein
MHEHMLYQDTDMTIDELWEERVEFLTTLIQENIDYLERIKHQFQTILSRVTGDENVDS